MAIKINNGYQVASLDAVDTRIMMSKAEMAAIDLDDFPEVYFCFCTDDLQWYVFKYDENAYDDPASCFTKMDTGNAKTAESGSSSERSAALAGASVGDLFYDTDDGKLYVCEKDSSGNKVWNEKTPSTGETMYDTTDGKLKYYDGSDWQTIGGSDGTSAQNATSGSTAPTSPNTGDLWLDTSTDPAVLKKWDGSSWVATTPSTGDMIYDTTNDQIMAYDGTKWKAVGGSVDSYSSASAITNPSAGKIYYTENDGGYKIYENGSFVSLCKTWQGTQAQYDAITSKDATTIYFISQA